MSAEDGEQELRERVRRLETLVASLEDRLQQLEVKGPLTVPAPPPVPPPPAPVAEAPAPKERADLEAHLGTYWLSRVGIVALITGIAYLITWRFGELGVFARVGLGYLLSAGLGAFGLWLSRRYSLFGRIVFGGGLALAYFVTYALHFIPSVRVIDSQALALVLLAGMVVGIVVIAHRMHSETVGPAPSPLRPRGWARWCGSWASGCLVGSRRSGGSWRRLACSRWALLCASAGTGSRASACWRWRSGGCSSWIWRACPSASASSPSSCSG